MPVLERSQILRPLVNGCVMLLKWVNGQQLTYQFIAVEFYLPQKKLLVKTFHLLEYFLIYFFQSSFFQESRFNWLKKKCMTIQQPLLIWLRESSYYLKTGNYSKTWYSSQGLKEDFWISKPLNYGKICKGITLWINCLSFHRFMEV